MLATIHMTVTAAVAASVDSIRATTKAHRGYSEIAQLTKAEHHSSALILLVLTLNKPFAFADTLLTAPMIDSYAA